MTVIENYWLRGYRILHFYQRKLELGLQLPLSAVAFWGHFYLSPH
jgi:hypothetical protein